MFLDPVVYKGTRFNEKAILDVLTHFKQNKGEAFSLRQRLRKVFQIKKKTLDGQRLPTQCDRKTAIRNK